MSYYVRYANCQSHFAEKQQAWACAQKLACDLDIYDSSSRRVVFASYRLVVNETTVFCRSLAKARDAYKAASPTSWQLDQWDWKSHAWVAVASSEKKAA